MIAGLRVLAIVPARGGSKRVPGKNTRVVGGKPLIAWTIEAARRSGYIDHVVVSSDDQVTLELAVQIGCDTALRRPDDLATDQTPGIDPVLHAIGAVPGFDIAVLLQPTSPLRRAEDIDACIEKCVAPEVNACVSVTPGVANPEWLYRLDFRGRMIPVSPKDAVSSGAEGTVHTLNGAVYVARTPWLTQHGTFFSPETVGHSMPREISLDIDTPEDMEIADKMLNQRRNAV